ncbi:hypothetical protein ABZ719_18285 [Streptomyces sp. NPDC006743]|uniref:hypothetical protein n=1 Tax=Streptomyces sp. NPDC006743 TaxID=3154480 RepID=UPI00345697CE
MAGAEAAADVVEEEAVRLVYRPQPADTLVGLRVRARIKRARSSAVTAGRRRGVPLFLT